MIAPGSVSVSPVNWPRCVRIVRGRFPAIHLFEDVADAADWPLLDAAARKSNPRLAETIGNLDLVPPARRVPGQLMAPFTHVSPDRANRFSDGSYGVFYVARTIETAVAETAHRHARFMAATGEAPGWSSQLTEIWLDLETELHDLRGGEAAFAVVLDAADYGEAQRLGGVLREGGSEGLVYPSARHKGGECAGLFFPDRFENPMHGRQLEFHWTGKRVDAIRDCASGEAWRNDP